MNYGDLMVWQWNTNKYIEIYWHRSKCWVWGRAYKDRSRFYIGKFTIHFPKVQP